MWANENFRSGGSSSRSGSRTLKDATNEAIRDWINHPQNTTIS